MTKGQDIVSVCGKNLNPNILITIALAVKIRTNGAEFYQGCF